MRKFKVGDCVSADSLFGLYEVTEIDEVKNRVFLKFWQQEIQAGVCEILQYFDDDTGWKVVDKPVVPKEPPLGLIPRFIWEQQVIDERNNERLEEIAGAIQRYLESKLPISVEWVQEYNEKITHGEKRSARSRELK